MYGELASIDSSIYDTSDELLVNAALFYSALKTKTKIVLGLKNVYLVLAKNFTFLYLLLSLTNLKCYSKYPNYWKMN